MSLTSLLEWNLYLHVVLLFVLHVVHNMSIVTFADSSVFSKYLVGVAISKFNTRLDIILKQNFFRNFIVAKIPSLGSYSLNYSGHQRCLFY